MSGDGLGSRCQSVKSVKGISIPRRKSLISLCGNPYCFVCCSLSGVAVYTSTRYIYVFAVNIVKNNEKRKAHYFQYYSKVFPENRDFFSRAPGFKPSRLSVKESALTASNIRVKLPCPTIFAVSVCPKSRAHGDRRCLRCRVSTGLSSMVLVLVLELVLVLPLLWFVTTIAAAWKRQWR